MIYNGFGNKSASDQMIVCIFDTPDAKLIESISGSYVPGNDSFFTADSYFFSVLAIFPNSVGDDEAQYKSLSSVSNIRRFPIQTPPPIWQTILMYGVGQGQPQFFIPINLVIHQASIVLTQLWKGTSGGGLNIAGVSTLNVNGKFLKSNYDADNNPLGKVRY